MGKAVGFCLGQLNSLPSSVTEFLCKKKSDKLNISPVVTVTDSMLIKHWGDHVYVPEFIVSHQYAHVDLPTDTKHCRSKSNLGKYPCMPHNEAQKQLCLGVNL